MSHLRITIILFTSFLISCATTGPGGKQSLILIPTSQEVEIGKGMDQEISRTEKKLGDQQWQNYLAEVGRKIVAVSDRKDIEYHFTVIESDQINAFAAPGGYVYFYTGLLKNMNSEAEMAAVLAHEISHVVARHSIRRIQTALGASLAAQLVLGKGSSEAINAAVGIGLNLAMAGYSREAEREADNYGIQYMVESGYNPQGMVDMFHTLARIGGSRGSANSFEQLVSTHPDTQERIRNAEAQIKSMSLGSGLRVGKDRYSQMKARL